MNYLSYTNCINCGNQHISIHREFAQCETCGSFSMLEKNKSELEQSNENEIKAFTLPPHGHDITESLYVFS